MSPTARRSAMMLSIAVLAALVAADRMGWIPSAEADDDAPAGDTPRHIYLQTAEASAKDRALLDAAGETARALDDAQALWAQARSECVIGKTAELAEAAFRERILAAARNLGVQNANATAVRTDAPAKTETAADRVLRPIALRLQFDTAAPQEIYRVIDVLENLPDLRTSISSISLVGPGLPQVPNQVTASIIISAIAVVGEGDQ